ncbi:MAG: aryl-sulfate sulfotransferase [Deltaproteobacteria bacterium]|nr:aryl-sulfate sulfotransferase [Deltaproteobacteria bacterium]
MHTQPKLTHLRHVAALVLTAGLVLACQAQAPGGAAADEAAEPEGLADVAETGALDTAAGREGAPADAARTSVDAQPGASDAESVPGDLAAAADDGAPADGGVDAAAPDTGGAEAPDASLQADQAEQADPADMGAATEAGTLQDGTLQDGEIQQDPSPGDADGDSAVDPDPGQTLQLANVAVQAVANNPLACRVTWTSNLPSSSVVLFGLGAPTMRMNLPALTTNHDVLVVGMRGNQAYTLKVRSQTATGAVASALAPPFTTGKLPDFLKPAVPTVGWADPQEPHFLVLAGIHLNLPGGFSPFEFPPTAAIYDDQGQVVWFHSQAKGSNLVAWWEHDKMLVAGGGPALQLNLAGDTLWQGKTAVLGVVETGGPPQPVTGMVHGDLRLLPSGNLLGIEFDVQSGIWGDQLVERKPDGSLVWLWSTFDYLPAGQGDWTHGNSLQPLDNADTVLYSPRNLNMIFKIDRKTGKFVLRLGEGGDFALQPGSGDDWFALQHAAEELPGNRILLYDNGTMERGFSRAVEYQYDLAAKTAKIVWQYKGEPGKPFFSPGQGSVQRLPGGDTLVSAPDWKAGWAMPSSLRRVSPAGTLRWRLDLPVVSDYPTVAYRAQRIDLPGLEFVAPGEEP